MPHIDPSKETLVGRVVTTVRHQTGGPQPDQIPRHKIVLVLANHGSLESVEVRQALDEAVEAGLLDAEGETVWIPERDSIEIPDVLTSDDAELSEQGKDIIEEITGERPD